MFWGCILTHKEGYKMKDDDESNLIHISNCTLGPNAKGNKYIL